MNRLILVAVLAVLPFGCRASSDETSSSITVFAAASLTEAFESVARGFEEANPGVQVKLAFAGSQSLRAQLENGARADVFASANPKHMDAVEAADLVEAPRVFASNALVVAVPEDNPAGIERFSDLSRANKIVLAGVQVPAGAYAQRVLQKSRVSLGDIFVDAVLEQIVSRENDVRATLQKVVLGEADAAIVYATDARSAGLPVIEIPAELNVRASYPIAATRGSQRGRHFAEYVSSLDGQERLRAFGFGSATDGMSASRQ